LSSISRIVALRVVPSSSVTIQVSPSRWKCTR
jgi:hypothetical protein